MAGIGERLADDPDRVREVDDPGIRRAAPADDLRQLEDDGDRPQRLGEPARADGLLADQPEPRRQRLVPETRLLATDTELDEDGVRAVDRGVAVGRQKHTAGEALAGQHPLGEPADDRQPLLVDVQQGDLVDRDPVARREMPSTSSGV